MTPRQIDLVQATFKDVAAIKEDAAVIFYGRLFEMDPSLKSLFMGNIKEQGRKLMATLGPKFTPEVKEAWTATYGLVSSVMIDAAKEAPMKMELKALFFQAMEKKGQFSQ